MAKAVCEEYGQSPSFNWKKYESAMRAALSALEKAGYCVVPVRPTKAMVSAGEAVGGPFITSYTAMIEAGRRR
jgi:hypothetical protein